ncbi:glycosyltransferase family 4 protein [Frigidibacter sp. MR17.14]|uniref:glycosyltransferase family 4 protein n=1 Tax=Frigidibacter sp. MR17.14 TaxID=3126509 RepID=UPI003012F0E7
MRQALILTTLDIASRQNNREHHAIAALASRVERLVVVYRRRGLEGGSALAGAPPRIETRAGVTYVGVTPPLTPREGLARDLTAVRRRGAAALALGLDGLGVLRDIATILALRRAAARALAPRLGPALCEAFGPWAVTAALPLRRAGRIGRLVYVDRDYEPGFMATAPRRLWAARIERHAAARADLTLSIGARLAARFADVPGARVALSPTGVDAARFRPRLRALPEPHLLHLGQLAPWSGIEDLLAALPRIAPPPAGLRLTLIGPAEPGYAARLRGLITAAATPHLRIDWPGEIARDEVPGVLDRAGIGFAVFRPVPLRCHAAPLKVLEYFAAGLPVLALEGSEAGDLVAATGTGRLAPCTPEGIAAAVQALLADAGGYAAASARGPEVARGHDWARVMAAEWERIGAPLGAEPHLRAAGPVGLAEG